MTPSGPTFANPRTAALLLAAGLLAAAAGAHAQERSTALLLTTSGSPALPAAAPQGLDDVRAQQKTQTVKALNGAAFARRSVIAPDTVPIHGVAHKTSWLNPPGIQPRSEWFHQEGWQLDGGGLSLKSRF